MPPPPELQLQVGVVSFVGVVPDTLGAIGAVISAATVKDVTESVPPLTLVLLVTYNVQSV